MFRDFDAGCGRAVGVASVLVLSLAIFGCGKDDSCDEDVTEVAEDEETPLGFSADEHLDRAEDSGDLEIDWEEFGETAELSWAGERTGGILAFERDEDYGWGPADDAIVCHDTVEMEFAVEMETDDGRLDEEFDVELKARSADRAGFRYSTDDFDGTLEYEPDEENAWVDEYRVEGTFDEDGFSGEVVARVLTDIEDGGELRSRIDLGNW